MPDTGAMPPGVSPQPGTPTTTPEDTSIPPGSADTDTAMLTEAAGTAGNTTHPMLDTVGQGRHDTTAAGTDIVDGLRGEANDKLGDLSPDSQEAVANALRHLADASQQGAFGQHAGAAVAVAHAILAFESAADAEPDAANQSLINGWADTASGAMASLAGAPTKSWKGLPVVGF